MRKIDLFFERLVESVNRRTAESKPISRQWLKAEALSIAANNQSDADAALAIYDEVFDDEEYDYD